MKPPHILVGVPRGPVVHKGFDESVGRFLGQAHSKYRLHELWISGKSLAEAQNTIVDAMEAGPYTHLLLLEDDHTGHTLSMLDNLLAADRPVVGIHYFSRHIPYFSTAMDFIGVKQGKERYREHRQTGAQLEEVDLIGFGMTLIRRDVFGHLEKPYFRRSDEQGPSFATDRDFFRRLRKQGVRPHVSYAFQLTHRGVNLGNVMFKRRMFLGSRLHMFMQGANSLKRTRCTPETHHA